MKRFIALAALMVASTAAQAGDSYSFDIGGRTIRIEKPRDCDDASCVSISIPGVYESGPKRGKRPRVEPDAADDDMPSSQKPVQETRKPLGPPLTKDSAAGKETVEPANGVTKVAPPPAAAATDNRPPQAATVAPTSRVPEPAAPATAVAPPATDTAPAKRPDPIVAAAPPSAPAQDQAAANAGPDKLSPLGVWLTEEKEGKVRIEQCGSNLCGYSVNAKSNENGEKILINMKPGGDNKWTGRIHDPKSGSNYDSTIALKGPDRLRVQGCAFGGMFCGGQTWSRMN
ncbi:MAG: DUF2147 domain-containing protein [Rhodopseudomonas palustris]|uniref:DUF2147 domain-containing protein n=1 Tax=Rhodopseudomonas palustris TaxID=1076 RepID=A0A933VW80_RHOPL|nr:DUF2147 domain-containing protein [Rhodopseudomonas palustris]